MRRKLPINLEILKWARTSYNLSIEEVADKIGKKSEIIQEWEEGKSSPTYIQLETLAHKIYKRPVALFFFPEIPSEIDPKADFRTVPQEFIDALPPEILKQYRNAKVLQLNLSELLKDEQITDRSIIDDFKITNKTEIQTLVLELRKYLGIDLNMQIEWKNTEEAFKTWRNLLEENGIFVFKDAFKNDSYSGFCIYDEKYPIIMINNSTPKNRQIFTLFHELAHLLLKSGGIDLLDKEIFNRGDQYFSNVEMICNEFAGEFLVPLSWLKQDNLIVNDKNILILANKYSVSKEVILRKFLNLKIISKKMYKFYVDKFYENISTQKKKSGGDYYKTKKVYLGDKYINLSFQKYYQGKISIERLSEFLTISVKNITNFEHKALAIKV